MEKSRENLVAGVQKTAENLRAKLSLGAKSLLPRPDVPIKNAIGIPAAGSGFVRILMFIIAGILLLGILLIAVDQRITPVFQRSPGAQGYIPIPGTDTTEVFWLTPTSVSDITVGQPPPTVTQPGAPAATEPLFTTSILSQGSYSITMDVLINNEYPQDIGSAEQRIFFVMSQTIDSPTLRVGLDNSKNTVYITCFTNEGLQQSVQINNVPIYKPFRVGLVVTPYTLEGYLNGKLVQTKNLKAASILPTNGDTIFAPSNILTSDSPPKALSTGISVQNVRTFGYAALPAEMQGRMGDLLRARDYKLPSRFS